MKRSARQPSMGTGIYTVAEAARLLQVTPRQVMGWTEGYINHLNGETRISPSLLDRDDATPGLPTFHDLVELSFVREFCNAGATLPNIRKAAQILREEWKTPYPFAKDKLAVLNRELIDREDLKTIIGKQQVFTFAREFFQNFDFDAEGLAAAWHPLGKDHLVVLDPHRSFGAPIDTRSGVRTDVLYRMFLSENRDAETVAQWYEVSPEAVSDAVRFEEEWQQAA